MGGERWRTEATEMMATVAGSRRRTNEDQPVSTQENDAGGTYHVGTKGTEESATKISKWSGEKSEELE